MHQATSDLLEFFKYEHLPLELALISKPFCELAHQVANDDRLTGAEVTVGLRKLLESKDCIVRSAL